MLIAETLAIHKLRSIITSILPVPLNSSKITSSMRRAGIRPAQLRTTSDLFRLLPPDCERPRHNRFGRRSACPVHAAAYITLPDGRHYGVVGVREARNGIQQNYSISRLCWTSRLAFSITISATCTCRDGRLVKVELMTSLFHLIAACRELLLPHASSAARSARLPDDRNNTN